MNYAIINSNGVSLVVSSTKSVIKELTCHEFCHKYIPNYSYEIIPENVFMQVKDKLYITDRDSFYFSFADHKGKVSGKIGKDFSIHDLITLVDYCLELVRQTKRQYTLHGSSCEVNGKAIVLIGGASGIGKTSVNFKLIKKGAIYIGDDKIILSDKGEILPGIRKMSLNKKILNNTIDLNVINNRMFATNHDNNIPIRMFVQPVTCPRGALFVDKWDRHKASFHLYEELSRKIRGTSRRINNFEVPIKSIDTPSLSLDRSNIANLMSEKFPFYTIYGSSNLVANEILRMVAEK